MSGLKESDLSYLADLLEPFCSKQFLEEYWGKRFLHIPGSKNKFEGLFSWRLLNKVLEQNRFEPPRLRLCKAGREILPEQYLEFPPVLGNTMGRRVRASELTQELHEGATLILNYADELSDPLRDVAVKLERVFHRYVIVNLYAAFRTDNGFSRHWDNHDTFILQVAGEKKWLVYEPKSDQNLSESTIWDGLLKPGAMFHIPRGWPHVAYPVDQPSLHLTITVRSHTGLDILHWIIERLSDSADARGNVPFDANAERQCRYVEELREQLVRMWPSDLIRMFIDDVDGAASPRPIMQLPDSLAHSTKIDEATSVQLSSAGRIVSSGYGENGVIHFRYSRKHGSCDPSLLPVLEVINDGAKHPVGDLIALVGNPEYAAKVLELLTKLIKEGIVIAEPAL